MERQDDFNAFGELHIDLFVPRPFTAAVGFTPRWTSDQRDVVARLYADDFRSLGCAGP